jgi:hypothetical protein
MHTEAINHDPAITLGDWLGGKLSDLGTLLGEKVACGRAQVGQAVTHGMEQAQTLRSATGKGLQVAWVVLVGLAGWLGRHPATVALALSLGLTVGVVSYLAGPLVCSSLLGLLGAAGGFGLVWLGRHAQVWFGRHALPGSGRSRGGGCFFVHIINVICAPPTPRAFAQSWRGGVIHQSLPGPGLLS